jgi:hypothetical protein
MKHIPKKDFSLATLTMLAAILFSSCGMPTKQILPVATEGTPPAGKCLIVVERKSTSIGAWVNNEVDDNGMHVGTLTSGGKLVWLRDPGYMRLSGPCALGSHTYPRLSQVDITVVAGKTYHYWMYLHDIDGPGKYTNWVPKGDEMNKTTADFQNYGTGLKYISN